MIVLCPCGVEFYARPYDVEKRGRKYCSFACYQRLGGPGKTRGPDKGTWKGDAVGYAALHVWVRTERGKPGTCEHCGTMVGRIEWANRSGEYRRVVGDWIALCKRCHARYDNPTCAKGHERNPQNTYYDKAGYPHCRPCRNERLRLQRRGLWDGKRATRSRIRERFGHAR